MQFGFHGLQFAIAPWTKADHIREVKTILRKGVDTANLSPKRWAELNREFAEWIGVKESDILTTGGEASTVPPGSNPTTPKATNANLNNNNLTIAITSSKSMFDRGSIAMEPGQDGNIEDGTASFRAENQLSKTCSQIEECVKGGKIVFRIGVKGPLSSAYENTGFIMQMVFRIDREGFGRGGLEEQKKNEYPRVLPGMRFITPILHPNIHPNTGEIVAGNGVINFYDLGQDVGEPHPNLTIQKIVEKIQFLLKHPVFEIPKPINFHETSYHL